MNRLWAKNRNRLGVLAPGQYAAASRAVPGSGGVDARVREDLQYQAKLERARNMEPLSVGDEKRSP